MQSQVKSMKYQNKVKKIVLISAFSAIALIIFMVESLVPPLVAIPGVKLGLSNAVILTSMYILGKREAFIIMLIKILLGNFFTGQAVSLIYSLAGGIACFLAMLIFKGLLNKNQIWAVSVFGAIAHNTAQIITAYLILSTSLLYYWLVLMCSSVITGVFTGVLSQVVVERVEKIKI